MDLLTSVITSYGLGRQTELLQLMFTITHHYVVKQSNTDFSIVIQNSACISNKSSLLNVDNRLQSIWELAKLGFALLRNTTVF